jgi:3-methylcrotonyl-CoA carboxylase alpha subunit
MEHMALIEHEGAALPGEKRAPQEIFFVAALAQLLRENERDQHASPWDELDGWRLNGALSRELTFRCGDRSETVRVTYLGETFRLEIGEQTISARGRLIGQNRIVAEFDGRRQELVAVTTGKAFHIFIQGGNWKLEWIDPLDVAAESASGHGSLLAPMPGRITAVLVEQGERVDKGAPLLILEAMKMEHKLSAPSAGVVRAFRCSLDDQVGEGAELVDFEPEAA